MYTSFSTMTIVGVSSSSVYKLKGGQTYTMLVLRSLIERRVLTEVFCQSTQA